MKNQTEAAPGGHSLQQSTASISPAETQSCQYGKLVSRSNRSLFSFIGTITLLVLSYSAVVSTPSQFLRAPLQLPPRLRGFFSGILGEQQHRMALKEVLEKASMAQSQTVIITTLNAAWAQDNTMVDLFLESFWHGQGTRPLLQHLVIVCVDAAAYRRCLRIHPHCLVITTPGINFAREQHLLSADYIKFMWRRIQFLHSVLQLNYSFVFTDTDVLWLRDPFPQLDEHPQSDFQIACDQYNGRPFDIHNHPNAGFTHVRANKRTVRLYEYWYEQRKRSAKMADQEVFNAMKLEQPFRDIGLQMHFLDTQYFAGFCSLETTNMTKAITVHANCCKGLKAKLFDLRNMLEEWKKWQAPRHTVNNTASQGKLRLSQNASQAYLRSKFYSPLACPGSWHKH